MCVCVHTHMYRDSNKCLYTMIKSTRKHVTKGGTCSYIIHVHASMCSMSCMSRMCSMYVYHLYHTCECEASCTRVCKKGKIYIRYN